MRLRLKLGNFSYKGQDRFLIEVDLDDITTVEELQVFLSRKFQIKQQIAIKVDDYTLLADQKLVTLTNNDKITAHIIEHSTDDSCQFCGMLQSLAHLRELFNSTQINQNSFHNHIHNQPSIPNKQTTTLQPYKQQIKHITKKNQLPYSDHSSLEEVEEKIQKKCKLNPTIKKPAKKVQLDSSESQTPIATNKATINTNKNKQSVQLQINNQSSLLKTTQNPNTQPNKQIITLSTQPKVTFTQLPAKQQPLAKNTKKPILDSSSDDESPEVVQAKPKPNPQIGKPIKKIVDESSSDSESVQATANKKQPILSQPSKQNILSLNIPVFQFQLKLKQSPEEEFQSKQVKWKQAFISSQPIKPLKEKEPVKISQPVKPIPQPNQTCKVDLQQFESDPSIIQQDDYISVKYTYLDTQKFQPSVEYIKKAQLITNNLVEKKLEIVISGHSDPLIINYGEIIFIEIELNGMTDERKKKLEALNCSKNSQSQQPIIKENNQKANLVINSQLKLIGKQVKEQLNKFKNQINYYYSDKNYYKDDFIQQHSSNNQEQRKFLFQYFKVMDVKLLLNFPKIKKVITSEQQLIEVIEDFLKETAGNEVHFELRKNEEGKVGIRKKNQA